MADQTTLMGLLKTPSQIRKEQQDRLMEESLARSQSADAQRLYWRYYSTTRYHL